MKKKAFKKIELENIKQCPECGSSKIIYNKKRDEIICRECGLIFSELTSEQEKKFEVASDII